MKRRRGWTENGGTRIDLVRADTPKMMFFPKEKEDEGRSRDYILMISVSNDIILGDGVLPDVSGGSTANPSSQPPNIHSIYYAE
ncbi:hypothetical protein V1477_017057 [Vespula maculifrons]|uniref:Uncharacterized protein n=1 Tax=Vespula maculifrons TaxID=7453 RepID=A0ABD2B4Z6_VESMC